ncbi:cytochrome b [Rhodoferax sp. BAB1]|jgi:cytochrome b561|uniref:cytochrome b n=1 Tax=Rhodoferax sp. BAB1 TaxID=2741720 RepID=UPI001576A592|nr:cytochrome b/b6 domain-containing protein [Rhodoferax sp. BAB1]QKO20572.1 cytochrome b/b6 domain-containing protein [Rhodoferax sp. BAB1]
MQTFRYAKSQIAIHWLAAALIVFLLVTGTFVLAELPNTPAKTGNLRIHMILGALAGLFVITRIVLRKRLPAPPSSAGDKLARAGHLALNLVVLLLAVSGTVLALQSGAFDAVFGAGSLPEDFRQFTPRQIHGLASRVAMGLIALHMLAALYHQFIVKDGLLARMGLGSRKPDRLR